MDWVSIVVTGIASGLAVALAELMFRGKSRGAAYLAVVLVLVGISYGVARQVVSPLVRGWQADKIFREVPAFAAIERLEPAAAAELKKVARSGNMAELRLRARQQIVRMLFKQLAAQDPTLCHEYYHPPSGSSRDFSTYLTKATQEAEIAALADVLSSVASGGQSPPDAAVVGPSLLVAFHALEQRHGNTVYALLETAEKAEGADRAKVCIITTDLYKEIFKLPADQQGPLLRHMLAGASQ